MFEYFVDNYVGTLKYPGTSMNACKVQESSSVQLSSGLLQINLPCPLTRFNASHHFQIGHSLLYSFAPAACGYLIFELLVTPLLRAYGNSVHSASTFH